MSVKLWFIGWFSVAGLVLNAGAQAAPAVKLTVYNDNLALVKDTRELALQAGAAPLRFTEVAGKINPTSVHFRSLDDPQGVKVLEQNFEYDLVGAARLMEKYIDKEITITLRDGTLAEGKLLSAAEGWLVVQTPDGALRVVQQGEQIRDVSLAKLPDGLITKPTLVWLLKSAKGGNQRCEVTYLTEGISWKADYVAVVNQDDTAIGLSGWVTIDNQSGATYKDAQLKLIAGDVNRVKEPPRERFAMKLAAAAPMADEAGGFQEKAFFEYHLYTLPYPTTIGDRQTKQLSLLSAENVRLKKFTFTTARRMTKRSPLK